MSGRLALVLEGAPRPADARTLSPNGRACWQVRRQARRRLQLHTWAMARQQDPLPRWERVRITFRLTVPQQRRRDTDNLLGGAGKAIVDALVALHIMPDDDSAHVEYAPVEWIVQRGQRRAEVVIEQMVERSERA